VQQIEKNTAACFSKYNQAKKLGHVAHSREVCACPAQGLPVADFVLRKFGAKG